LIIRKQIDTEQLDRTSFGQIEVLFSATLALLLLAVFVFLLGLVRIGSCDHAWLARQRPGRLRSSWGLRVSSVIAVILFIQRFDEEEIVARH
jgi:hypothetical protein